MIYLLDTNVWIEVLRKPSSLQYYGPHFLPAAKP